VAATKLAMRELARRWLALDADSGDRQANNALWRIVLVRLAWDPRTRDYLARRTKQGKSKKEIMRCLKRYLAREVFAVLKDLEPPPTATAPRP
jgi:transposase